MHDKTAYRRSRRTGCRGLGAELRNLKWHPISAQISFKNLNAQSSASPMVQGQKIQRFGVFNIWRPTSQGGLGVLQQRYEAYVVFEKIYYFYIF
jgi:hypothetical protein